MIGHAQAAVNQMRVSIAIAQYKCAEELLNLHDGMVVPTIEMINELVGRGLNDMDASIIAYHAREIARERNAK